MNTLSQKVSYSYDLPHSLIATEPATPRDHSRLFVYDTATSGIAFDYFYNIAKYIPAHSLMVVNETAVAPSRLTLYKSTGGKVICLFLLNEQLGQSDQISLIVDRGIEVGDILFSNSGERIVEIIAHDRDSIFHAKLTIPKMALLSLLDNVGEMPIPLYLRKTKLSRSQLRDKYQTIFAKPSAQLSSVAAPTASLHFTPKVFNDLDRFGIERVSVRLEVGLGTFAPLTDDNLSKGELHTEWYCVPKLTSEAINIAKQEGRAITAVGTTTARTLESIAQTMNNDLLTDARSRHPEPRRGPFGTSRGIPSCKGIPSWRNDNSSTKYSESKSVSGGSDPDSIHKEGEYVSTNIFIRPGYSFKYVNHLITNFHLPNSSLMMLVEALLQSKNAKMPLVDLYNIAIKERFRFYSFGDCMLIL